MSLELDGLLARLADADLGVQMPALEQAAAVVQRLTSAAINIFETTPAIFPAAERLLKFGPAMLAPLEAEFLKQTDRERKTHAAIVLLYLGSKTGVDYLLNELASGGELAVTISTVVSSAGVAEAAPLIEARLLEYDLLRDPYGAGSLIMSLKKLGWAFSPELMDYLSRPGLSKNIQLALEWDTRV